MRRGEIYLVNFGKVRPALIVQNDIANRNIDFKGVSLLPITSCINGGSLRVGLQGRDNLDSNSEICINELCTLDISRIKLDNILTTLTAAELKEINMKLIDHLGL